MQDYFRELSGKIISLLSGEETLLLNLEGERSDFIRLNQNRIRQAGHVNQQVLHMTFIARQRQSEASMDLAMDLSADFMRASQLLEQLREQIAFLPEDPFINFSTSVNNTQYIGENKLPPSGQALEEIIEIASGLDLVGIWASGEVFNGFANSLGQFNWHSNHNFSLDWSVYSLTDKAVKQNYAGTQWNVDIVQQKITYARETLPLLKSPMKTIKPGYYRAYIAPGAMQELVDLLGWGGFSLKSHRTAQTPFIKMLDEGKTLNEQVSFIENHAKGATPQFTSTGHIKPDQVALIDKGIYRGCLASARSAKEYNANVNCDTEQPQSLEIAGGNLLQDKVFAELGTGIYVSDLWYCNYSDHNNCRITGMTRFACLWVESGVPIAPLNVMRFDESIYNILGDNLIALTRDREHIYDSSSYEKRSQASSTLPGALVDDFHLTL